MLTRKDKKNDFNNQDIYVGIDGTDLTDYHS
jgi:hypothetical protein